MKFSVFVFINTSRFKVCTYDEVSVIFKLVATRKTRRTNKRGSKMIKRREEKSKRKELKQHEGIKACDNDYRQ